MINERAIPSGGGVSGRGGGRRPLRSRLAVFSFLLLLAPSGMLHGTTKGWLEMVPFGEPLASQGFERMMSQGSVTVYRDPSSPSIRLAAEGGFDRPPQEVLDLLLDYDRQRGAVERVSQCRVLGKKGNRLWVYQRLKLPVVSDRDFTLEVTWGRKGDVLWIHYWSVKHKETPETKKAVRVKHHQGSWQLRADGNGQSTLARYQTCIGLGGWVPQSMATKGAAKSIPRLFASLQELLDKGPPQAK